MRLVGRRRQPSEPGGDDAVPDHAQDADDEEVRGRRKEPSRLSHAAKVRERDPGDAKHAEDDAIGMEWRKRRRQRRDAGRDGHRHGQDVVDQQRRRRGECRRDADVVLRDQVGATAVRIGRDGLAIRDHDDRQQDRDPDGDRQRVAERGVPGQDQDEQDFLGRVRDGGERVGREDRERDGSAEPFVSRLRERHRGADQGALQHRQSHGRVRA